jgi:NAD(P)-dependent dehydrogenase (short-subunit alcohol dehydrogenase family)
MPSARTFDNRSTSDDVLAGMDLSGRHAVITGTTSGLGEESARALAAHGATVTMLARDPAKLDAAVERVRGAVPDADLRSGLVDLASLTSVRDCAARLGDAPIDMLLNNAGVMACPLQRTADGFEMQFGTNHLGHFLLTLLLLPALSRSEAPRVVTTSSAAHGLADVDLDDPNYEHTDYEPWVAYGRSKSANAHFASELARRTGEGLKSFSVHPGVIWTELMRHQSPELLEAAAERVKDRVKTIPQGAATQLYAATAPELADHNGFYLADCAPGRRGEPTEYGGVKDFLFDEGTAARLWDLSEQFVGERLAD